MAIGRFDLEKFFASPASVATVAEAGDLFSFLSRKIDLPAGVAALITRERGDFDVCPPGGDINGDGATQILFARTTPIDVALRIDRLFSDDGYEAIADVELRVSVVPDRGELECVRDRVLGSNRKVDRGVLGRLFESHARNVLSQIAGKHAIEALVDGDVNGSVVAEIAEAMSAVCFASGMIIEQEPRVQFASPTYRQVRLSRQRTAQQAAEQAAQRQLEQAVERAQQEHMAHLEGLLTRLHGMAAASPDVEFGELMRTFSESERGEMYAALFASPSQGPATQWLIVGAGNDLLIYEPSNCESPARTIRLPDDVGAVRSVQTVMGSAGEARSGVGGQLLVGANRGVYEVNLAGDHAVRSFGYDGPTIVRGGVNSAVRVGQRILASHSELGLLSWSDDQPAVAVPLLAERTRGAKAVRNVGFHDGKVICTIDRDLMVMDADQPIESTLRIFSGSATVLTAACPTDRGVYAGNADGQVLFWRWDAVNESPTIVHRGPAGGNRPAESVHVIHEGGIERVIFTDTSLAVHARVAGDSFTCRYEAGGQTLRRVEVAPDVLAATNDIRDRLFLWSPGLPGSPRATIAVARQTGHSVQDVCLVPVHRHA